MKAFNVKRHNCEGNTIVFRPSEMYDSLYYAYLINNYSAQDSQSMAESVINWARRKLIGSVYKDDILSVEVFDRN